jgi:hypothetical protein
MSDERTLRFIRLWHDYHGPCDVCCDPHCVHIQAGERARDLVRFGGSLPPDPLSDEEIMNTALKGRAPGGRPSIGPGSDDDMNKALLQLEALFPAFPNATGYSHLMRLVLEEVDRNRQGVCKLHGGNFDGRVVDTTLLPYFEDSVPDMMYVVGHGEQSQIYGRVSPTDLDYICEATDNPNENLDTKVD